jgi:hypothetical protein
VGQRTFLSSSLKCLSCINFDARQFLMNFENVCRASTLTHDKGVCDVPNKWRTTKVCLPCRILPNGLYRAS